MGFRLFCGGEISVLSPEHIIGILGIRLRRADEQHGSSAAKDSDFLRRDETTGNSGAPGSTVDETETVAGKRNVRVGAESGACRAS